MDNRGLSVALSVLYERPAPVLERANENVREEGTNNDQVIVPAKSGTIGKLILFEIEIVKMRLMVTLSHVFLQVLSLRARPYLLLVELLWADID